MLREINHPVNPWVIWGLIIVCGLFFTLAVLKRFLWDDDGRR